MLEPELQKQLTSILFILPILLLIASLSLIFLGKKWGPIIGLITGLLAAASFVACGILVNAISSSTIIITIGYVSALFSADLVIVGFFIESLFNGKSGNTK
jgi:hypothetical protein